MNAIALSTVSSAEKLQKTFECSNNNNNYNSITDSSTFYQYADGVSPRDYTIIVKNEIKFTMDDLILLDKSSPFHRTHSPTTSNTKTKKITKSNSYHGGGGLFKAKATVLKQDCFDGHIATSLTEMDTDGRGIVTSDGDSGDAGRDYAALMLKGCCSDPNTYSGGGTVNDINNIDECSEYDTFLGGSSINMANIAAGSSSGSSSRRSTRSHSKSRTSCCLRVNAFISRNWYISYLVPLSILIALLIVAYLTRDYAKQLLYWIELQNPWITFGIFMLLFTIVSFPIVVGYFVLLITAGYLFGCFKGWFTVILGANMGIAIAHATIRSFRHRIPIQKLIKNETGRAILRVISGPRAFKVVLFTRLTPIPFGVQNAIFGISSIKLRDYHLATFFGLLPAQTINVYLGSTLRSMHEVLNNENTKLTGYISFIFEVVCGIALMVWVLQKARKELSTTLLNDISNEGKHIDIQV